MPIPGRVLASRLRRGRRTSSPDPRPVGMVELVSRRQLAGWVVLPRGAAPVLVQLRVGPVVVSKTYTARQGEPGSRGAGRRRGNEPLQPWELPEPRRGRRHGGGGDVHTFAFRVRGIWPYTRKGTRISVLVDGRPLPMAGHGLFLRSTVDGPHSPQELGERLQQGYVLNQRGLLTLKKSLDVSWQKSVSELYARVREVLAAEHGIDVFLIYGTLLGAVRDGGPIGHDDDFDAAYVSSHHDGAAAAAELEQIGLTLVRHGFGVEGMPTHLHVTDPADPSHRIDLFHLFFDKKQRLAFPFGVAGTSTYGVEEWQGLRSSRFLDHDVLTPADAERLLAHIYGDDWKRPRPGFRWGRDRTSRAASGRLRPAQRTRLYWADFYSRHEFADGSTFSQFVLERPELPHNVVDIGCGDGRDSCALASSERLVLGLDASAEGVLRGAEHAQRLDVSDSVSFAVCDVADPESMSALLKEFRARTGGAVTMYLRFFLHAIPDDVADVLLTTLKDFAEPGDWFAAEFRTVADEARNHVHGRHYRRYVDAEALRRQLEGELGFTVEYFTEGQGLSPYGDEDPVLCRILARRG